MKYLILFLFLAACGKHQQPPVQDLRDSDGDSIRNNIDSDPFVANIVAIDEINATLEFQTGQNNLKKHKYELSNKQDLDSHSKNLLVKNQLVLKDKNFFSEFSKMSIKPYDQLTEDLASKTRVIINFSKTKTPPKSIYLVTSESQIKISDWSETVELSLTQNDLKSIISGKSYLWLSHMDANPVTRTDVSEKSFRVFYNRGSQSEVFYISKELTVMQILKKMGISNFKYIEEENLLTTTIKPEISEWWVRILNDNDIVIVKANIRELSDHYFSTLEYKTGSISRFNGHPYSHFSLNKNINARTLLRIRATRKAARFTESSQDKRVRIGGRDNSDKYGCVDHIRSLSTEFQSEFSYEEFEQVFMMNGHYSQQQKESLEVRYLQDEVGPFWEIELNNGENFDLHLDKISQALYSPTGVYRSDECIGNDRNQSYSNNLQSLERSLILNIEAFVEIIPE